VRVVADEGGRAQAEVVYTWSRGRVLLVWRLGQGDAKGSGCEEGSGQHA
jgi:hypothetical protein